MTTEQFKQLLTTQLPIAWIAGVRLGYAKEHEVQTYVTLDFLNQNPFSSMFWAVQGMAAEFAGGLMLLEKIAATKQNMATLIIQNEATYAKKALGTIKFTCVQGIAIEEAIAKASHSSEPVLLTLTSIGTDESEEVVATFKFTWSLKKRG